MPAGALLSLVSLVVGWAALFPVRGRLGSAGYHVSSLPTGLLGWSMVYSLALALGTGYRWWSVALALAAWIAMVAACGVLISRAGDSRAATQKQPPSIRSYVLVFAVVAVFAWIIAAQGVTAYSADGWSQYVLDGLVAHDNGETTIRSLGERMVLLPAVHAGYYAFGGEFPYVIHPVMGLVTAALLFMGLWWTAFARLRTRWRVLLSGGVTFLLVSNAVFLFMSLYIHSHMITAMYTLLAVIAVERAMRWGDRGVRGYGEAEPAWMLVAGMATAAILIARPDGGAYSIIPVTLAAAALVREGATRSAVNSFFAPLVAVEALAILGGIVQVGVWDSAKMDATALFAFMAMQTVGWIVVRVLVRRDLAWLTTGANAVRLLVGVTPLLLMVIWRRSGAEGVAAFQNMSTNLLSMGGYRFVWPYVVSILGLSLVFRPKGARNPYAVYILYAIVQFFAVAFAVHALTHPGRLGWGDSFNRVAFHILPVCYLYVGVFAGQLASVWARSTAED